MAERLVVDVAAQLAVSLFREADEWAAKGDVANAAAALRLARSQLVVLGLDSRTAAKAWAERRVALTTDELTVRAADAEAARLEETARMAAKAETEALVAKLAKGEATVLETQQALAMVLGGRKT